MIENFDLELSAQLQILNELVEKALGHKKLNSQNKRKFMKIQEEVYENKSLLPEIRGKE